MKILLSWLREFVDVPGTADDIAKTMSLRGFAVEGIDQTGDDAVLDFEVTANRPDCMSVVGMAREIAVAYHLPLAFPAPSFARGNAPADAKAAPVAAERSTSDGDPHIDIEAIDLCPRYAGVLAQVAVQPSPSWLQSRLTATGVRPISNLVDITNYVLLELGQPMHAFDFAALRGGQIVVRRARADEPIRTLDGQSRTLSPDMLVIADAERAVAIAGVMGGSESEVGANTRTVLFESACFAPLSIRRTSRALGLKTEASMRFERGVDPALAPVALARACALLEATTSGLVTGSVVDHSPSMIEPRQIRMRRHRIGGVLGTAIADEEIRRIMGGLGFVLTEITDGWNVAVPTRRVDVTREIDLIEEVARHYGLDRLPVTFPAVTHPPPPVDPRVLRARQLRTVMTGSGFSEAVTFGFIGAQAAQPFVPADEVVPIANPLSETFAVLRPTPVPGLLDAVAHNRRREQRDVRLFEVGASFTRTAGEHRRLTCVWTGTGTPEHWSGGHRNVDFFDIMAVSLRALEAMRLSPRVDVHRTDWLVPGRTARLIVDDQTVGTIGQLDPSLAERHGIPPHDAVYVADIDLDEADRHRPAHDTHVAPLPRFPSIVRDISVLVADTLPATDLRKTILEAGGASLVEVREFDRYQGKGVPDGKVSLSFHLTFRSPDRTLTDAEVQPVMDAVVGAIVSRHQGQQR